MRHCANRNKMGIRTSVSFGERKDYRRFKALLDLRGLSLSREVNIWMYGRMAEYDPNNANYWLQKQKEIQEGYYETINKRRNKLKRALQRQSEPGKDTVYQGFRI